MSVNLVDLGDLLCWVNPNHSSFQIDNFITRKAGCGTPYGMLRQCLRELEGRITTLRYEYVEADEAKGLMWSPRNELDREYRSQRIAHMEREAMIFWRQASVLMRHLGPLTRERLENLDRDFWMATMRRRCLIELATIGTLSDGTVQKLTTMRPVYANAILETIGGLNRLEARARLFDPDMSPDIDAKLDRDLEEASRVSSDRISRETIERLPVLSGVLSAEDPCRSQ